MNEDARGFEDLVGTADDHGSCYFDGSEFALRAAIEEEHYWHVHRRRIIAGELERFTGTSRAGLLELGCGIGTVATHLNRAGFEVDYADVFGRALELAVQRARVALGAAARPRRFLRVDVTQSIPRGYRGLLLFDVVEHLPDDDRVMRNIREALSGAADAFVMITVPAFPGLWSPWDDLEKHKRRYTRAQAVDLLERCGFDVMRATYLFAPLFFAAAAMKGVRSLRGAFGGDAQARRITDLTEGRNSPLLNRIMLGALGLEKSWLARGRLPFGTSVLAIGRPRGS